MDRFQLAMPATLEVVAPAGPKRMLTLVTSNISSGGAFFTSADHVPEGSRVRLNVTLSIEKLRAFFGHSGGVGLSVSGSVVRSSDQGMAGQFEKRYRMRPLGMGFARG